MWPFVLEPLRPVNLSASSSESELSEEKKDEQFDKEFREKLTSGSNRKSSNEVTQRSSLGHMKINEAAATAEDRDSWRGILRAANHSHGGWH